MLTLSARLERHEVDLGFDRRIFEVKSRRTDIVADGENRKDRLDGAGGTQKMPVEDFVDDIDRPLNLLPMRRSTALSSISSPEASRYRGR